MDHAHGIDQTRNAFQHAHRVRVVQGLAEFLQGVQISDIVLRFIGRVGDFSIEGSPLLAKETDWSDRLLLIIAYLNEFRFGCLQNGQHRLDIGPFDLIEQKVEFSHSFLPVIEFCPWTNVICFATDLFALGQNLIRVKERRPLSFVECFSLTCSI